MSEGYKGYYHEAILSYLHKLDFSFSEITFSDELRTIRHQTKYYEYVINVIYANKVLEFINKIFFRLNSLVRI